jgi:3-hydroxyacyl-[acyl-carrier-protein] dehydratase
MGAEPLTPREVLAAVPQCPPFRFIDEINELDDDHIVAAYRFPTDADFYRGHFPGNPITPGVLLLEAMAQAGVVAHGIFLLGRRDAAAPAFVTLFTEASVEFTGIVPPGERVVIRGRRLLFRRRLLRSAVEVQRGDGTVVCHGTLAGLGVPA